MQLSSLVTEQFRLVESQKKALKKLGIETISELLFHFPERYGDTAEAKQIADLKAGDNALLFGQISGLQTKKAFFKKIPMAEARLEDSSGSIKIVWFHQPYLAKMLRSGSLVRVEGKVSERKGELYITNPEVAEVDSLPLDGGSSLFGPGESGTLYGVYPESRGISSKWFFHSIQTLLKTKIFEEFSDPIPQPVLERYNLPTLATALIWIHAPKKESDAIAARKRFAFQEIFLIQLEKQLERKNQEKRDSFKIFKTSDEINSFTFRFPFPLTGAQKRAIEAILSDFRKDYPMSRLLEGDVGSGKTAVAATSAFAAVTTPPKNQDFGALQVAFMAPTEILAGQHFESFMEYFAYLGISIGLITGSGCKKFPSKVNPKEATDISRAQLLKWVAGGEIPILVGTHSLIQKTVEFKNLAYIVIDEQHRFGTAQRARLRHKKDNILPHLLSMTATPIPRTLSLTIYGDLDLTLLDELPVGRKQIITAIVAPDGREEVYEKIRKLISDGRQAYVICPRIDAPDPNKESALNVKSVTEEAERLKKRVFPEFEIGVLHSKLKPAEKDAVMKDFKNGLVQLLCATSVVEVGVNVPNATIIIIEGAERFGLAQLHQLRGRVLRSSHQAYCWIFSDTKTKKSLERLDALTEAKNGFELAEFDLAARGAGSLRGIKQWGISDLGMEAIKNIKMVEAAREEAHFLAETDPELAKHQELKTALSEKRKIHFE